MTADQQRTLDEAILDGRLVDAVATYRTATGASLTEAELYVRQRSDAVTETAAPEAMHVSNSTSFGPFSATIASSRSALPAAAVKRIVIAVVAVVVLTTLVPIIITVGALVLQFKLGGIGSIFSIVKEPYYPDVVKQIQGDPGLRNALGTPIAIEDGKVSCGYISDDSVQKKANCDIPVHGPKAAGSVRVQIVDTTNNLDLGAWLTVGGRTIPINS